MTTATPLPPQLRSALIALVAYAAALVPACDSDGGATRSAPEPAKPTVDAPPPAPAASPPPAAPAEPEPQRLVLLAGGDVNLGRRAGQQILQDPAYDPFSDLAPWFGAADHVFVNLECPLSDQGGETQSPRNRLIFTGPPGGAPLLARAGVDIVSIANNHAWDYGKSGFFETLDHLDAAGVAAVGASREPNGQYRPRVVEVGGFSIAWFAVTDIWNQGPIEQHYGRFHVAWATPDLLVAEVKRARDQHDLVLLSYHGGGEYILVPMLWTRHFVKAMMDQGVDAVVGHHPHVMHGVGWTDERPAFFSLGNLVFNMHRDHPETGVGFLARLTYEKLDGNTRLSEVAACPYRIVGHEPKRYAGRGEAALNRAFAAQLRRLSITVGGTTVGERQADGCFLLSPPADATGPG